MTAPALQQYAQGQGVVSADNLNTFIQSCDTVPQLRAFIGTVGMQVYLRGLVDVNDGGAGVFYWNASGTGPDDGVNEIVPPGSALGCWTRITATVGSGVIVLSGSSVTISNAAETVVVNKTTGSATTILFPGQPVQWEKHTVVDGKGDAASNNITVNGNGFNINGASTSVISANYGARQFQFNGTQWNVISTT